MAKSAGITQLSEITYLDQVGIPTFAAVRPRDAGPGISYYNGKGTTRADAHAGALMEAIERHAGEHCDYQVITGSRARLSDRFELIDPDHLAIPRLRPLSDETELEWVAGFDLIQRKEILAPLNAVLCPYDRAKAIFVTSTNGLASGNSLLEATCHAACEIIERDTQSIVMARCELRDVIHRLAPGLNAGDSALAPPRISEKALPKRATRLLTLLKRAGLKVELFSLTHTARIPTIECIISSDIDAGFGGAHGGVGTHPDSRVAVLRAITEAAQSRLTCIQGGREDLHPLMKDRVPAAAKDSHRVCATDYWIRFDEIPNWRNDYINEDLDLILQELPCFGIKHLIAFDLTHPEVAIPVVRLVAPAAESWCVYHRHIGRGHLGSRALEELF